MPGSIRALIVVIVLAAAVLFVIRRSATAFISQAEFRFWVKAWFAVTIIGFVTPNFWLMLLLTGAAAMLMARHYPHRPALFMLLFTALPMSGADIPGFGGVNYLFRINYQLTLVIILLVPLVLMESRRDGRRGFQLEDKLFLAFFILSWMLSIRAADQSITNFMRTGFTLALSSLVPYFAFSRYIREREELNRVVLAFLIPVLMYAPIGMFEMFKYWSLYLHPPDVWGLGLGKGSAARAGLMRANGPVGHGSPIVFGSFFVLAAGFLLALAPGRIGGRKLWLGAGAICGGVISTLSRGPWVGLALVYLVYWLISPGRASKIVTYGLPVSILSVLFLVTPFGAKLWSLLPFIGSTAAESTVDYRQQVFDVSWDVIMKHPLFGRFDPQSLPEMQVLMSGGIIDIVNTYLLIALEQGLVGLFLFCGFFGVVLTRLRRAYRRLDPERGLDAQAGRALFSTMVGLLIVMITVSPVGQMPLLYWSFSGVCVAYARYLRRSDSTMYQMTSTATSTSTPTIG